MSIASRRLTQIRQLSEQLSAIRMEMNEIRFTKVDEQLAESKELLASLQEQQTQEEALVADCRKQEEAQKGTADAASSRTGRKMRSSLRSF